eukprot:gb/GECG01014440.1/.p1 GENE.gb/GECG01014440.1/~~gb/GECG01014440.1/.p1  ORF type:complete len:464 (+),score=31.57 gb/GECG01014440.1/:1-1392(+)
MDSHRYMRRRRPGYSISQIPRFNYLAEETKVNSKPGPDAYTLPGSFQKQPKSRPSSGFAPPVQYNHYRGYVGEYWDSEPGPGAYLGAGDSKWSGPDPLRPSSLAKQRVVALGNSPGTGGCRSLGSIFGRFVESHVGSGKTSSRHQKLLHELQSTGRPRSTGRTRPHTSPENTRNTSLVCREDFESTNVIRKPSYKKYHIGEQGSSSFKGIERPELFKPKADVPPTGAYHKDLGWEHGTAVLTSKTSRPRTVSVATRSRGVRDTGSRTSGFNTPSVSEESWVFRSNTQRSPTHFQETNPSADDELCTDSELNQQSSLQEQQGEFQANNSMDFPYGESTLSSEVVEIPSFSFNTDDLRQRDPAVQDPKDGSKSNRSRLRVGTPASTQHNSSSRPKTGSTRPSGRFTFRYSDSNNLSKSSRLLPLRKRTKSLENSRRLPRVPHTPTTVSTYFQTSSMNRNPKKRWI